MHVYKVIIGQPVGECMARMDTDTVGSLCDRLRSARCPALTNCQSRVEPTEGCCLICGRNVLEYSVLL